MKLAQKQQKVVYERIHTRKIDREVARRAMKRKGLRQFCKHYKGDKHSSYFAFHWDEYRG